MPTIKNENVRKAVAALTNAEEFLQKPYDHLASEPGYFRCCSDIAQVRGVIRSIIKEICAEYRDREAGAGKPPRTCTIDG